MTRLIWDTDNPDAEYELGQAADPVEPTDAANKRYVDAQMGGGGGATTIIFFRATFNEDGSIAEVLEASTRLNQEIDPGATEFSALPVNQPHTHYSFVRSDNTRYFPAGTAISFDLSVVNKGYLERDVLLGDIGYAPLTAAGTFRGLTDVDFVGGSTTFSPPQFNGHQLNSATFQGIGTRFRDNDADSNNRVLSFEINIDNNFQQSEIIRDFIAGTVIRRPADDLISIDLTGTCNAPEFLPGSSATLLDRVRVNILIDNDAAQIAAIAGFTDADGITWDQADIGGSGLYEFAIGATDAQRQAFTSSLVSSILTQRNRSIIHRFFHWDEAGNQGIVSDAADFREQLQSQTTSDLLSVSTQWPTGGDPDYTGDEGRENQIPTVKGLDNYMANNVGRSLVEAYTPTAQNPFPTDTFSGWLIKNVLSNEMWFWNPSSAALASNSPRDSGAYVRIAGDTSVALTTESPPTTAPNVANEANIRINRGTGEVFLWSGPGATDWVDLTAGGGTTVAANPSVTGADPALSSITIGDTDYRVTGGGGNVDNTAIAPLSVRVGGTTAGDGNFRIEEFDNHIARNARLGDEINVTEFTVFNLLGVNGFSIPIADVPPEVSAGEVYIDISGSADTTLTPGSYLAVYAVSGDNLNGTFTNIRNIVNGEAGDALAFPAGSTMRTGIRFEVFTFHAEESIAIARVSDNQRALTINDGSNVADFLHPPTVNGQPLVETTPQITWTFGMPSRGRDVQADTIYPCVMYQQNLIGQGLRLQASHFQVEGNNPHMLYRLNNDVSPPEWQAVGTNRTTGGIHFPSNFSSIEFAISFSEAQAHGFAQNRPNILDSQFFAHDNVGTRVANIDISHGIPGFSGSSSDAGVQQNHQDIVHEQDEVDHLTSRVEVLENEAIGGERIRVSAWRDGTIGNSIDEITTYMVRGGTSRLPFSLTQSTTGTAIFRQDSTAFPQDLFTEFNTHLNGALANLGTYTHTSPTINMDVNWGGEIFTRHAVLTLSDGNNAIEMPLLVSYDGQGSAHHRLYYPYPVDAAFNYSSISVRYFLNDFLSPDGTNNTASSFSLTQIGSGNTLTLAMSTTDRNALNQAITDVSDIEIHFTERDGEASVFIVDTASNNTVNEANHSYAGYVLSSIELMGYTYSATANAPNPNGAITLVIEGDGGGTNVVPNPTVTDATPALTSVSIDGVNFRTGDVTVDGTPEAGQVGRWVTGPDGEPNSIGGINFTDLASLDLLLVEANVPLRATDLIAEHEYMFRIYTRNPQTAVGTVLSESNFFFNTQGGETAATGFNPNNPTAIGSNTALTFLVSWSGGAIQAIIDQAEPLLIPTVRLPGIGQFVANNDANLGRDITLTRKTDLFLGQRLGNGTASLDTGTVNWRVFRTDNVNYTFVSGAEVDASGSPMLGGRGFWTYVDATNNPTFLTQVNVTNSNNLIG